MPMATTRSSATTTPRMAMIRRGRSRPRPARPPGPPGGLPGPRRRGVLGPRGPGLDWGGGCAGQAGPAPPGGIGPAGGHRASGRAARAAPAARRRPAAAPSGPPRPGCPRGALARCGAWPLPARAGTVPEPALRPLVHGCCPILAFAVISPHYIQRRASGRLGRCQISGELPSHQIVTTSRPDEPRSAGFPGSTPESASAPATSAARSGGRQSRRLVTSTSSSKLA